MSHARPERTQPLVLLDLDGTLMDSAPGIIASAQHAYRALGLPEPTYAELRSFVGPPITDSFPAHGVAPERVKEAVAAYRSVYVEHGMYDNSVFAGIPEQLQFLRDAGCILAVATSKPEVYAVPIAERFGLAPLVDGIFGAPLDENTSTKADVIAKAVAAFWEPPSVEGDEVPSRNHGIIMVGDRLHDVEGAAEHGIPCLGVTWGYAAPGELAEAGAIKTIDKVADLAATVLELLPSSCGHVG